MSPSPEEIKIEDIDFDRVAECRDKRVLKKYIKLLEEDGSYFTDLLKACKDKLLEVSPKEYYLLYPKHATEEEMAEVIRDVLEWEAEVKETDKALRASKSKSDKIWDDDPHMKIRVPVRGQEAAVARPNVQNSSEKDRAGVREARDSYARDKSKMKDYYAAWDSIDIDGMEEEMDEEERLEEEARRRHFEDLKEEQDSAQATTPIQVTGLPDGIPEAHRKHMADSEKEKGNEAFYSKDWAEAEAYYTRSLHFLGDDPSTWANRALVRLKLEKPEEALKDCDRALAINPTYMKALHRRGKALHELRRYGEAVTSFQQALAESPGNTQINGDLMLSRRHLREPPAAARRPPPRASEESGVIIEELSDDEEPAQRSAPSGPSEGYTRVLIEEDSESEEESVGGDVPPAAAQKFHKIAIEEVGSSDDEEPTRLPAAASPAQTSASEFQAASQFSGARPGYVFKTGAQGLGYYRDALAPAAAAARSAPPAATGATFAPAPRRPVPAPAEEPRKSPQSALAPAKVVEEQVCFDDMD